MTVARLDRISESHPLVCGANLMCEVRAAGPLFFRSEAEFRPMTLYSWIVWLKVTSAGVMLVPAGQEVAETVHGTSWCQTRSEHFEEWRIAGLKPLASSHQSALRCGSWGLLGNPSVFSILVTSCLTNQSGRDGRWAVSLDGEGN